MMSPLFRTTSVFTSLSPRTRSMSTCKPVKPARQRREQGERWRRAARRARERLLPKQALRLAVQLLDELARQQARVHDLHPAAYAELGQRRFQHQHLVLRPTRGGGEVPQARRVANLRSIRHLKNTGVALCRMGWCTRGYDETKLRGGGGGLA